MIVMLYKAEGGFTAHNYVVGVSIEVGSGVIQIHRSDKDGGNLRIEKPELEKLSDITVTPGAPEI